MSNISADMLIQAANTVKQRGNDYGNPAENFDRIARLWAAYLGHEVSRQDVGMLMSLVKIARLMATPGHEDSLVDLAGYAAATFEAVND